VQWAYAQAASVLLRNALVRRGGVYQRSKVSRVTAPQTRQRGRAMTTHGSRSSGQSRAKSRRAIPALCGPLARPVSRPMVRAMCTLGGSIRRSPADLRRAIPARLGLGATCTRIALPSPAQASSRPVVKRHSKKKKKPASGSPRCDASRHPLAVRLVKYKQPARASRAWGCLSARRQLVCAWRNRRQVASVPLSRRGVLDALRSGFTPEASKPSSF